MWVFCCAFCLISPVVVSLYLALSHPLAFLSSGMRYWRIYASLSVPCIFRFHSCNAILQSIYRDVHITAEQNRRWNRSKIVRCNGFIVQLYRIELLKSLSNHFTFCWMQFSLVRSYFSIEIGLTMVTLHFCCWGSHTWAQHTHEIKFDRWIASKICFLLFIRWTI